MTNNEKLKRFSLVELLTKIRFENTVCPLRAFYPAESKYQTISQRCAKYGYYTTSGIAKGACIQCIIDFLSEEVET